MEFVIILIVSFFTGMISLTIARDRNRDQIGWFILGFLFNLLGLIAIALLPKIHNETTFSCPECSATVKKDDEICSNCGEVFEDEDILTCTECGETVEEDDKFCPNCGGVFEDEATTSKDVCSKCGNQVNPKNKYCPKCGNKLDIDTDDHGFSEMTCTSCHTAYYDL